MKYRIRFEMVSKKELELLLQFLIFGFKIIKMGINNSNEMEEEMETIRQYLILNGTNIMYGLLILVIGITVAKKTKNVIRKVLERANVDKTLIGFTSQLIYFTVLIIIIIASLSKMGVNVNSMVAVLGAAGFAVALALQSSLSNFASGIIILILKPFKVGDFIDAAGISGEVVEIQIFNTILKTINNEVMIVPNSSVTGNNIKNYTDTHERRVDIAIGVAYDTDIKKVKAVIQKLVDADKRVLRNPGHRVVMTEFADSSINLSIRMWVKNANYWDVRFDMMERIKEEFDANNIEIPFPQRVVQIIKEA